MEREILFRGKRKDNGEWVEGVPVSNPFITCIFKLMDGISELTGFEVYPETVGQYTSLTDKNGRKIFDGDYCVVTRVGVLAYGVITFHQGCFIFKENGTGNLLRLCDIAINGCQIRVKGNIHDDPEMIE